MVTPKVSVIVPHYNDLKHLGLCLDSLTAQDIVDPFEIIIADNRSPIGIDAVRDFVGDRATVVDAPIKGAGPARNAGVEASSGKILAFIDSDCIAERDWLSHGVAALDKYDFIGGRVDVLVEPGRSMTGAEAFERVFAFDFKTYIEKKGFTGSGNLLCSREVFDAVGGFRSGVSEDVDWSHRATAKGFRLGYAPQAGIGHPARADWPSLRHKWHRLNRESYGIMAEKPMGSLRWLARAWLLPLSIPPHLLQVVTSPKLNSPGDRARGVMTLVAIRLWRFMDAHRLVLSKKDQR